MKNRKKQKRNLKPTICILVEGETEKTYFNTLRQKHKINISVKPEIVKKKSLRKWEEKLREVLQQYDKVYLLIELDRFFNDNLREELEYLRELLQNYPDKIILISPCIELWFLLHFISKINGTQCKQMIQKLREILPNYAKNKNTKKHQQLYNQKNILTAIKNARTLDGNFNWETLNGKIAQIYIVLEEILSAID